MPFAGLLKKGITLSLVTASLAATHAAQAQYVGRMSAFIEDARTGTVLAQVNPDLQRYPASLTKLMTLYMAFQALRGGQISLDQAVPVSVRASTREPSKLGLVPGGYITVEQAILGLVTKSANDAACALGELIGGDEDHFAAMMTGQAHALGMTATTFRNASGLPDPDQVTTARDLATLGRRLISDFPEDYHYFSTSMFYFHGREIPNHNPMLRFYPGADGMKTGYTAQAGLNLVASALRENVRLVGVVMGASSNAERTREMADLLDQGFQDEGVAPVERRSFAPRPLVLARNETSRRRMMQFLAANGPRHRTPLQVAEAPRGRLRKLGIIHYVLAKAPVTKHVKGTAARAVLHSKHRSKT
ncbi:D-alanyl-D-alanine carboxypeptidase family protein [Acetobacter conturbans]|uniref:D-alanyl-D-alanine carboxypeptidase n=1 Tax=Acetobacter conturbans TaxID=1737472 RepID=A0ABX0K267_9PROT|nr:D-alanyl-D-alanine carboxypeptidase family protein [Acetobacter conturbans]NHN88102.1 D-alanyl-D-alanine carboxypeptidase [Acetobacter conturbans]